MKSLKEKKLEEYSKWFDKEYDINSVNQWSLGIVASALTHHKLKKYGTDASYITNKLRELVENFRNQTLSEVEEMVEKQFKFCVEPMVLLRIKQGIKELRNEKI